MQQTQNKQIEQALEEQRKQNAEFRLKDERNLYEINQKEFQLEKDKIVSTYQSTIINFVFFFKCLTT